MHIKILCHVVLIINFIFLQGCGAKPEHFIPDFVEEWFEKDSSIPDLPDIKNNTSLKLLWSKSYSGEIDPSLNKVKLPVLYDKIFLFNNENEVFIVNKDNGEVTKKIQIELDILSDILPTASSIIFSTQQDTISSYDFNGKLLWQRIINGEILSLSQIYNDMFFARTVDGKLFSIDFITGEILWQSSIPFSSLSIRGIGDPVVFDDKLYMGLDNGRLMALNPFDGNVIWSRQIVNIIGQTDIDRLSDIDSELKYLNGIIYLTSYNGVVAAIDSNDGRVIWRIKDSSVYSLEIIDDQIIYVNDQGHLISLNLYDGTTLWTQDILFNRLNSKPLILNDEIYVRDLQNYVHIFNLSSGELKGRIKLSEKPIGMKKSDNNLFILDSSLNLKMFSYIQDKN